MYKKLPKKLFLHPHSTGWHIPGYSSNGILLYTSQKKGDNYRRTDAGEHDELPPPYKRPNYKVIFREEFKDYINDIQEIFDPAGQPKVVIFNLIGNNDGTNLKYSAIYTIKELKDLLGDNLLFCSAHDKKYTPRHFDRKILELYDYQPDLTKKLDQYRKQTFSQDIINEIVLWKVNRYVHAQKDWLAMLNDFANDTNLEEEKLRTFLTHVLKNVNGVRLAMASSFLRFRNPGVYQIVDERTYRVVMREQRSQKSLSSITTINEQIHTYIAYLKTLKQLCDEKNIPFVDSDRILYQFDIIKNGDFN